MREIKYTNERGQSLVISDQDNYALLNITGLNPPTAIIQTNRIANFDGTAFTGSVVNQRNIVITMQLLGDAEDSRLNLYEVFKIKRKGTFYYRSDIIEARIEGYVEAVEVVPMSWPVVAMISLVCNKPYFEALDEIIADITSIDSHLEFPLELVSGGIELGTLQTFQEVNVINHGDIPVGMIIHFRSTGAVVNPKLLNTQTLEFIELSTTMESGDEITINTEVGQKRIERNRGGVIINLFNSLVIGSTFLQLHEGDNVLYGSATSGSTALLIEVQYRTKYSGV